MYRVTLYHQDAPLVHHPVRGSSFSVGAGPANDLVLTLGSARDQSLLFYRDRGGQWQAVRRDRPDQPAVPVDAGARIPLGSYAIGLEAGALPSGREAGGLAGDRSNGPLWVGCSPQILLLRSETEAVARLSAPVLVTGETGTGKELVARALHDLSERSGPYVAVNCGGLTETLLEDTLFGHERGAFTDAGRGRPGVFEQASGGTLFLDEIGELSLDQQAALLRALEERRVRRIGGVCDIPIDLRLVTATNRDIARRVREGRFRADLYHRIATLPLETTPLRARPIDILPLAIHFLSDAAPELGRKALSEEALTRLQGYAFPGNVRELRNRIYRAAALTPRTTIRAADLPLPGGRFEAPRFRLADEPVPRLERFVAQHGGNISSAAKALGVARTTLRDSLARGRPDRLPHLRETPGPCAALSGAGDSPRCPAVRSGVR